MKLVKLIFSAALINRKMALIEALGFIVTFLIIGSAFGFGFALVHRGKAPQSKEGVWILLTRLTLSAENAAVLRL